MRTRAWLLLFSCGVLAQEAAPPNGPRRIDPAWHALTGATVHVAPGRVLDRATVVLRGERIVSVGDAPPPAGARVWDLEGRHVYAGFLDLRVEVEAPPHKGRHWNPLVTPERRVRELDDGTAKELRELGFTAALLVPAGHVLKGRAALVSTAPRPPDPSEPPPRVYREDVAHAVAFAPGGGGREGFPTSEMGAIALVRQSLMDGLASPGPLLFDTENELQALRAAKVAREFARPAWLIGSGTEFRRLPALVDAGLPMILPLRFPRPPDVSSPGAVEAADLRDLMAWEQAPTNPRRLDAVGLPVALTSAKLEKRAQFLENLREAVRHGLAPDRALAMLTTNPAAILEAQVDFGTIEAGKRANLVIAGGLLFEGDGKVLDVWIDGKRHEVQPRSPEIAGEWELVFDPPRPPTTLRIDRKNQITVRSADREAPADRVRLLGDRLSFVFDQGVFTATVQGDVLRGRGDTGDGARFAFTARRIALPPPAEPPAPLPPPPPETLSTPFGPYGLDALPPQHARLIVTGATLWTCGPLGVVANGQVEVEGGRITYAGPARDFDGEGATVLEVEGRHVTPGIVDCHSHTGISGGVNDSGQAVTAEVRIGDVTDPDDVSWYRQLASGVTAANSLHGSANPIGGQNQVVKLRWGARHPDDMHFEGAPPGIKFALGENVKQSNWGDQFTTRYPQTRMGVEALLRDRFLAARAYTGSPRDLELDALQEVLRGKRLVHCHSYRQDEILMLCRVAKEFGFRIGTFQHVLEGYKVADAIRDGATGASAFSDWWAYKVEVQDAIPFNGALMHRIGVNVSFNSDSDDLARRLNVEAAKAVKYGGVPPADALKFVTLNPAIQLGVGDRVGSLEAGKDADFAVWSGDPLSAYSRCERTFLDGRAYFSLETDAAHRARIAAERRRIVQKILARPKKDEEKGPEGEDAAAKPEARGGPGAAGAAAWRRRLERLRDGGDPDAQRCGECGCLGEEGVR